MKPTIRRGLRATLLMSITGLMTLASLSGKAQNQTYINEDFSSGTTPTDWVLDSAGTNVTAGTCQDGLRVFSFTCADYPASSAGGVPPGFAGNVAVIDLDNVGGAASTSDSLYCLVTDTVNTTGATNLELSFDWEHESFGTTGTFRVEVWDSTSWQQVFSQGADGSGSNMIDITTYSNADLRVRFCFSTGGSTSASIWGSAVDNVLIQNISCPAPTNLTTTSVGADSVSLQWNSGDSSQISYIAQVTGPGGDTVSATDTTTTITGLQSGTNYTAKVREVCISTDTSLTSAPITFTTKCQAFSADLYNGFDSATAADPIPIDRFCWDTAGNENSQIELVTGTTNNDTDPPVSSPNKVTFNDADLTNGDTALLISPELTDLDGFDKRLRLQAAFEDVADSRLFVSVMASPAKTGSLTVVDTLTAKANQAAGAWQEFIIDLTDSSLIDTIDRHVAIANGDGTWESSVDNIRYEAIPSCLKPTGLTVTTLSSDSVTLSWNSQNAGNEWLVNYDSGTFTAGNGASTASALDTTLTLDTLSSRTSHQAYVREVCQNGDTSFFSNAVTFTVPCDPFTATYRQRFDGQGAVSPFGSRRFCWSTAGSESDQIDLVAFDNANDTDTPPTLPNKVTFNDADLTNGDTALLVSPEFSDLGSYDKQVTVEVAFEDTADSRIFAGVMGDPADPATFRIVDTFTVKPNQAEEAFSQFVLNLSDTSIIDSQRYVAFANGDGIFETSIDDFTYDTIPPCPAPDQQAVVQFTDTSAQLEWRSNGTGSTWVIEYDTAGFKPGTGSVLGGVTDTFATLDSLSPNTRYEAYIREICQSGDTGNYVNPLAFRTACDTPAPVSLPYQQDFEQLSGRYLGYAQFCNTGGNANWTFQSSDTAGRLQFSGSPITASSGTQAATLDYNKAGRDTVANDLILTLNMQNYQPSNPYVLYFDHREYQDSANLNDSVWIRGSQQDPWIGLYGLDSTAGSTYQTVGPLNVAKALRQQNQSFSSAFQVRFGQAGTSSIASTPADGRSFDDIRLTQQDVSLTKFAAPAQACGLTSQEVPSVTLANTGLDTLPASTTLQLNYQLDTNSYPTQPVSLNQPLAPGDSLNVRFSQAFDLSAVDTSYQLKAWIQWQPDLQAGNDTTQQTLTIRDPDLRADNILDTSARLAWNPTASTVTTQVLWDTAGFTPAAARNRAQTADSGLTAGSLQKVTTYEAYIQEVCANGDTGLLRGPVRFTTRDAANDLRALRLTEPARNCGLTANERVTLQLVNFGFDTIPAGTSFTVSFQKDNQSPVRQPVTLTRDAGPSDTLSITFNQQADLSQQGRNYQLTGTVNWPADQKGSNDTVQQFLYASNVPSKPTVTGDTVCTGARATLQATAPGQQVDWYADTTGSLLLRNTKTYRIRPQQDSTLYVRAYNNPDSCRSPYAAVNARVRPAPEVSFRTDSACANAPVPLNGQANLSTGSIQRFEWELGDGRTRSGQAIQPAYPTAGAYPVTFQAVSDQGCQGDTQLTQIIKPAPEAAFVSDTGCRGSALELTQRASSNGAAITAYQWRLGNGQTATGPVVDPAYSTAGTYDVTLTTPAANGCSDTVTQPAFVLPEPEAAFSAEEGCEGEPLAFTNQSAANGAANLEYRWRFGDGDSSSQVSPEHTYQIFGEQQPGLVAYYDSLGQTCADTASERIDVDRAIEASFTVDKEGSGTVIFIPDNAAADAYRWDFGNGDTAAITSPKYSYSETGTYTVTLQTVTAAGCGSTDSAQVTIESVGLADEPDPLSLSVYPNPVQQQQQLTVSYKLPRAAETRIQLRAVTGQVLYQQEAVRKAPGRQTALIPIPEQAKAGVYVVHITIGEDSYQRQVVLLPE